MEQREISMNVLRVLAVDDDIIYLKILEHMLIECGYVVTVAHHARDALNLLREKKDEYDIMITDVNMPEMDGFKLLEIIGLEMDVPVIMLSAECDVDSVMKGIKHGAVDYLVKPVRLEELKVIWKHVARKSLKGIKETICHTNKLDYASTSEDFHDSSWIGNRKNHGNERDSDDDDNSADSVEVTPAQKKRRVTWSKNLHTKFIDAVNQIGIDRAVPKKILDIMNIQGLSRENVASHLQKYKKGLKKDGMVLQEQFDPDIGTIGYGGSSDFMVVNNKRPPISSFENFDANRYKCMPETFTYLPTQQSANGHALLPTWCAHPLSLQNDFSQQYSTNTPSNQLITEQTSQLAIENRGLTTNSLEMSALTQASFNDLSYIPFPLRSNQLNYYTETSQVPLSHNANSARSSPQYNGYADGQDSGIFFSSTLLNRESLNDCPSVELNTMLPSEEEMQQFSACSGVDVEIGVLVNNDLEDVLGNFNEDLNQISPLDLPNFPAEISSPNFQSRNDIVYEDDLHAAVKQAEEEMQQFSACSGIDVETGVVENNDLEDVLSNYNEDLKQISLLDLPKHNFFHAAEEEMQQFSACSGIDVEIGVLMNNDLEDVLSNNEDLNQISLLDLQNLPAEISSPNFASRNDIVYEDDLHAAVKQAVSFS